MQARTYVALCALLLALCLVTPAHSATREVLTADAYELGEGNHLVIDVWELGVDVRAADSDRARITTELRISGTGAAKADAWIAARTPLIESTEDGLSISTSKSNEGFLGLGSLNRRRRLGIVAPLTSTPDITTSAGAISVEGDFASADPLRLRTASGNMALFGAAKSLEVRTTSGNAELKLMRPVEKLWMRTSSGAINLTGGARAVEIETASGDIDLAGLSGSATIETVSGNIVVAWDRLPDDAVVKLRSIKGRITVILPPDSTPQGTISTTSGEVSSDFPGTVAEDGISLKLAGDGPSLEVETATGAIVLQANPGWLAPSE